MKVLSRQSKSGNSVALFDLRASSEDNGATRRPNTILLCPLAHADSVGLSVENIFKDTKKGPGSQTATVASPQPARPAVIAGKMLRVRCPSSETDCSFFCK